MPLETRYIECREAIDMHPDLHAAHLLIDISVNSTEPKITLESIEVIQEYWGEGIGSRALRALCQIADEVGATIELEVGADEAEIDLSAWYMRHGFDWMLGYMSREPQGKSLIHSWDGL